jgi:Ca2+-binding RTX toxin-like protein
LLASIENVIGSGFADTLTGDADANILTGLADNDTLIGNNGNDMLLGGAGNDTLIGGQGLNNLAGGAGNDVFRFDSTALDGAALNDVIADFNTAQDQLEFEASLFTVAAGQTIDDYVQITGNNTLQVDTDGTGGGAAFTTIATFTAPVAGPVSIVFDDALAGPNQTNNTSVIA